MKRKAFIVAVLIGASFFFAAHHASAQSPQPTTAASSDDDGSSGRPWGRLWAYVPISIVVGGGAVVARRQLKARGWSWS